MPKASGPDYIEGGLMLRGRGALTSGIKEARANWALSWRAVRVEVPLLWRRVAHEMAL